MSNPKVAVFWTDEATHASKLSELSMGRLRQGWGTPRTSLLDGGKIRPFAQWMQNYSLDSQKYWHSTPSLDYCKTRYFILSRMLKLERGDLVVIPRMPGLGEFCIARVTEGYAFDDAEFEGRQDFRHVVHVDNGMRSFRYNASPATVAIAAKFRHYRAAVNIVADNTYAQKIRELYAFGVS